MNNVIPLLISVYKTFGRDAAKRFLTPSRKFVEMACAKTGANVAEAINERDEAVEEMLEFVESLVDADFTDPETHPED